MDTDGAAQDEMVSDGPGQYNTHQHHAAVSSLIRSMSPLTSSGTSTSSSTTSNSQTDIHMLPVAENWCHTQVFFLYNLS